MGRLVEVVFSFALICSVSSQRGTVETNYGYNPYHQPSKLVQAPNYYHNQQSTPLVYDGSKQSPIVVSVQHPSSVPNYHQQHQQYQTVAHPGYNVQPTAQVPYTAQQNIYHQTLPYSQANQYSVNQPLQPVGQSNLYIPFNQFQQISTNNDFRKPVLQSKPTNTVPQIRQKIGTIKSVPLFHHQVYHPLHTSVQHGNHANQQNPVQKQQLTAPPSPPRIYTNFHPISPPKPAPIQQAPASIQKAQDKPVTEEQEEDKEEINEEEEEENEKLEDEEDHSDVREHDEEYMTDDEEDNGRYRHYQREADEDEDEDRSHRYSESRPSKLSKFKYPKEYDRHSYYKDKYFSKPFKTDPDYKNFRDFKEPKVEYKMYKYSKSSNKPDRKEYIEGKGSENIPVVQHNEKSYKEQWIISSKTSSMTNEE